MAKTFRPQALSFLSKVNAAAARGAELRISSSGPDYSLALCLCREKLIQLSDRIVRNHIAYYRVLPV